MFCGKEPKDKNREHVLPQWLLELTGDPKRVVNFGINYRSGNTVRFDWSNFVVPSCSTCNESYSYLEEKAKGYVERILQREALTSLEHVDFLDWMDKVRIGLWIAYHYIQGNPTDISPHFHISTRIAKKDRMIAIYPISNDEIGLNAFGIESLIFHRNPSCFGLKVNNIFILNASSDYLFSARCGFPYPRECMTWLDGENALMMSVNNFDISRSIKHPLIRKNIIKPSVHLYQPIMLEDNTGQYQSGFLGDYNSFNLFIAQHTIPPYPSGKGVLFSQKLDGVGAIYDQEMPIEFDSINGVHCKPISEIVKQVYELQGRIFKDYKYTAHNKSLYVEHKRFCKTLLNENKRTITYWESVGRKNICTKISD